MDETSIRDSIPSSMTTSETQQTYFHEWLEETSALTYESSLRILIVLSQQPLETGSGVYLREIVQELQKLGHKPYVLAAHYRPLTTNDFPFLNSEQIFTTIFDNGENAEIAEISFPISGMSIVMPYHHRPFRTLSMHMLDEYSKVWTAKLRSIASIVRPHVIHINHLWLMPGIARSAIPWMPIVATSHGTEFKLLHDTPLFAPLILPGVQSLDAIMPISIDTANASIEIMGVRPDRIHLIGNGYNDHLFQILPRQLGESLLRHLLNQYHDLPTWDKLVLYVGKFADFKGIPYLIRAAKEYSESEQQNVITLIIGEGSKEVRSKLEELVKKMGMANRILLPGKLPYEEVGLLMNMADVFVLPSIDEPFGLVLLEALACGVRSVAADRGGPSFFVPMELREKGYVTLVNQLRLLINQQPDPMDEDRYVMDLAQAISRHLSFQTSASEKQIIRDAVKNQIWALKVKEIVHVYFSAIQHRYKVDEQSS